MTPASRAGGGESDDAEEEAFGTVVHYGSKQVCVRGTRCRCAHAAAVAIPWSMLGGHQAAWVEAGAFAYY
eukprot:917447-Alexandrium_andersonii.AAC.1